MLIKTLQKVLSSHLAAEPSERVAKECVAAIKVALFGSAAPKVLTDAEKAKAAKAAKAAAAKTKKAANKKDAADAVAIINSESGDDDADGDLDGLDDLE